MTAILEFLIRLFSRGNVAETAPLATPAKKTSTPTAAAAIANPIAAAKFADMPGIREFFSQFQVKVPIERRMRLCSAYGCRNQTDLTVSPDLIAELKAMHAANVLDGMTERHFFRKAIARLESATAKTAGVERDRPSLDFAGSGDPSQLDCVDEAANSTSFLLILGTYGMVKYHTVEKPIWKGGLTRWTHYAALIVDIKSNIQYAIDSGIGKTGEEPLIIEETRFYV